MKKAQYISNFLGEYTESKIFWVILECKPNSFWPIEITSSFKNITLKLPILRNFYLHLTKYKKKFIIEKQKNFNFSSSIEIKKYINQLLK